MLLILYNGLGILHYVQLRKDSMIEAPEKWRILHYVQLRNDNNEPMNLQLSILHYVKLRKDLSLNM